MTPEEALTRLKEREEVLQICYWYEGEKLGPVLDAAAVLPFMTTDPDLVRQIFSILVDEGELEAAERGYRFTETGRKKAARLFADTFTEFQLGAHGECTAGCCDEESGEVCEHNHGHGHGGRALGGHGHAH
ncbi:MAG: hypothetical protein AAGB11_12175 [Pseudomonadota bacterium]